MECAGGFSIAPAIESGEDNGYNVGVGVEMMQVMFQFGDSLFPNRFGGMSITCPNMLIMLKQI